MKTANGNHQGFESLIRIARHFILKQNIHQIIKNYGTS